MVSTVHHMHICFFSYAYILALVPADDGINQHALVVHCRL